MIKLENGLQLKREYELNEYNITIDDINLLLDEYVKYKLIVTDVKVI